MVGRAGLVLEALCSFGVVLSVGANRWEAREKLQALEVSSFALPVSRAFALPPLPRDLASGSEPHPVQGYAVLTRTPLEDARALADKEIAEVKRLAAEQERKAVEFAELSGRGKAFDFLMKDAEEVWGLASNRARVGARGAWSPWVS
jgi:hypothetical protein